MREAKRWLVVAGYAVAMAWVEAAVVYYLRLMINRIEPYQTEPFPKVAGLSWFELVREAATLVMLLSVGILAGRAWRARWGYAALAFGIWDIFYYVFLKVMTGWPHSLFDWDILFLLPLPWWGPVMAPMLIAALMIFWGTLASQCGPDDSRLISEWRAWLVNFFGMGLALYVFMADALRVVSQGEDAVRRMLPDQFGWGLFGVSLVMMSAPVAQALWRLRRKKSAAFWPGAPELGSE